MRRRDILHALAAAPWLAARPAWANSDSLQDRVRHLAAQLAEQPYSAPAAVLAPAIAGLNYEAYNQIRFRPERALWRSEPLPFQLQFFHRGGGANDRVDLIEVHDGVETPIQFSANLFDYGPHQTVAPVENIGFSGFRVHSQINNDDYFDEFAVFLGGCYFRAVGRGQVYGLSARMLAINTGEATAEEFPKFRTFWIERPAADAGSLVVHALTDSPSCCGAHRVVLTPGDTTRMEIETTIFARVALGTLGLAPMSSMYGWGDEGATAQDDFRPEVHDSDCFALRTSQGASLVRPLVRTKTKQMSPFQDTNPVGFGLQQRDRAFASYQDLHDHYERRPDLWVTPLGGWGPGEVRLLELPAPGEWEDNIAAFWRPRTILAAGQSLSVQYRLDWGVSGPLPKLAPVLSSRSGGNPFGPGRLYVIDFGLIGPDGLEASVIASTGTVSGVALQPNPHSGGSRLSFALVPNTDSPIQILACLKQAGNIVSEIWHNQWTKAL